MRTLKIQPEFHSLLVKFEAIPHCHPIPILCLVFSDCLKIFFSVAGLKELGFTQAARFVFVL